MFENNGHQFVAALLLAEAASTGERASHELRRANSRRPADKEDADSIGTMSSLRRLTPTGGAPIHGT
jgi:hypothetical protein